MGQSLADVLGQIRGGFAMHEAGKKLAELVQAVNATKKPGEITLTIKVAPDKVDDRVVTMKPSIKTKIPEKGFNEGIFFIGADGRLSKEDPAQLAMELERKQQGVASLERSEAALNQLGRG